MHQMDEAIARAKAIYEQVTGQAAPEASVGSPYARIPPEVDPEEYVTKKAATLLEKVQQVIINRRPNTTGAPRAVGAPAPSGEDVLPTMPIPAVVIRTEEELRLVLEMPGVARSSLEVEVQGADLRVRAERPAVVVDRGDQVLASDFSMGRVERRFTLPQSIEPNHVNATLVDGLLTIRVRMQTSSNRTQRIEVR